MGESDLVDALSHTKRGTKSPLICWEDAITRGKTLTLATGETEKEIERTDNNDIEDARKFYLSHALPRPPQCAPLTGEVMLVHSKTSSSASRADHVTDDDDDVITESDIIRIVIKPSADITDQEVSMRLSGYAPLSEWKFDVYLTDLTRGIHLNNFLDRVLDNNEASCIDIPVSAVMPKGKSVSEICGHRLKVSVTGVWPFRFYLLNCVVGRDITLTADTVQVGEEDDWCQQERNSYTSPPNNAPTTSLLATTRAAQLDGLIHKAPVKKPKNKVPSTATPISIRSMNLSRGKSLPSRPVSRPVRSAHCPIPSAQKSFQKLLQIKQQSRYEMMSRIEKDQIGIRVLASTVIFD